MTTLDTDLAPAEPPRLIVFWRRYKRNRAALLGLALFVIVLLMALTAGIVDPGDPLRRAGAPLTPPLTDWATPLGTNAGKRWSATHRRSQPSGRAGRGVWAPRTNHFHEGHQRDARPE